MLNPYASHLGERHAFEVIQETPRRLYEVTAALGSAGVEWRRAPGKWNAREIICHLGDCEIVFAYRLRQTLTEDHHVIQPFDQEKWAGTYGGLDVRMALDVFSSVREWNVALVRGASPETLAKHVTHPERGEMTFQTVVDTMGGHDLNHVGQLDAIVAAFVRA